MRNSYDVIEIDNYIILNIHVLQNFISENNLFLSINLVLKHAKPNIGKIFKTNTIFITKYFNLNWNIVKSYIFTEKMVDFK